MCHYKLRLSLSAPPIPIEIKKEIQLEIAHVLFIEIGGLVLTMVLTGSYFRSSKVAFTYENAGVRQTIRSSIPLTRFPYGTRKNVGEKVVKRTPVSSV